MKSIKALMKSIWEKIKNIEKELSLKMFFMVCFLFISMIPLSIIGFYSYQQSKEVAESKIQTYITEIMKQLQKRIDSQMQKMEEISFSIHHASIVQENLPLLKFSGDIHEIKTFADTQSKRAAMNFSSYFQSNHMITHLLDTIVLKNAEGHAFSYGTKLSTQEGEKLLRVAQKNVQKSSLWLLTASDKVYNEPIFYSRSNTEKQGTAGLELIIKPSNKFFKSIYEDVSFGTQATLFMVNEAGEALFDDDSRATVGFLKDAIAGLQRGVENSISTPTIYGDHYYILASIEEVPWYLVCKIPIDFINRENLQIRNSILLIAFFSILISLILSFMVSALISNPLKNLIRSMKANAHELSVTNVTGEHKSFLGTKYYGNYSEVLDALREMWHELKASKDEIILLNKELEDRVKARTVELSKSNDDLNQALATIKQTQDQLIQSEKMAMLGKLVAGVAHEINTPIGVGVTAASYLEQCTAEFIKTYQEGQMKKTEFEKLIFSIQETSQVVLLNLNKASELVKSFKQVAVDQTGEDKRKFNVREYLELNLKSLNPEIKTRKHEVSIQCPSDIEFYGSPGAFSQIITNFIMNSILHAFEKKQPGKILIKVEAKGEWMELWYEDNGKGIPKDVLPNIFDPFFTTKRNSGGTGLGLNVVFNIIYYTFKGQIICKSHLGKGTTFVVHLPMLTEDKTEK